MKPVGSTTWADDVEAEEAELGQGTFSKLQFDPSFLSLVFL